MDDGSSDRTGRSPRRLRSTVPSGVERCKRTPGKLRRLNQGIRLAVGAVLPVPGRRRRRRSWARRRAPRRPARAERDSGLGMLCDSGCSAGRADWPGILPTGGRTTTSGSGTAPHSGFPGLLQRELLRSRGSRAAGRRVRRKSPAELRHRACVQARAAGLRIVFLPRARGEQQYLKGFRAIVRDFDRMGAAAMPLSGGTATSSATRRSATSARNFRMLLLRKALLAVRAPIWPLRPG